MQPIPLTSSVTCAIALLVTVVSAANAANAYKCVDEDGATYFSDRQCEGSLEQTVIDIKPAPAASGAEMTNIRERHDRQQRILDAAAADRRELSTERAAEQARKRSEQDAICNADRARLEKLDSRHCTRERGCTVYGLTKKDAAGNTVFASEQEKRAEVNRLKQSIAINCR